MTARAGSAAGVRPGEAALFASNCAHFDVLPNDDVTLARRNCTVRNAAVRRADRPLRASMSEPWVPSGRTFGKL